MNNNIQKIIEDGYKILGGRRLKQEATKKSPLNCERCGKFGETFTTSEGDKSSEYCADCRKEVLSKILFG